MLESRLGETAALLTAISWTASALTLEAACKRASSLAVNLMRLFLGLLLLSLLCWFLRGKALPTDATGHAWLWLSLSGVIGFAVGDICLLRAFTVTGARISMLIMASVPPITALIGWTLLGEALTARGILGMVLTIGGIVLVVLERNREKDGRLSHPLAGVLLAFGGALGQAVGLVLSKYGMGAYDAFAATQIRVMAGVAGLFFVFAVTRGWESLRSALQDRRTVVLSSTGGFLSVTLGVSFSLLAVQHTSTGIASTIMSIVPVLIIPPAVLLFRERVTAREVTGAVIAVAGVALLFL
jgi:drug/metabolite transporter (DMT)-like permease